MNDSNLYKCFMIVYEKDNNRNNNYISINKQLGQLITKYTAIDTINDYDKWVNYALKYNYTTTTYIENSKNEGKGKLGCNLSHQLLFRDIMNRESKEEYNTQDTNWFLVMEDDIGIKKNITPVKFDRFMKRLIYDLEEYSPKTKFVQLCIYNQFLAKQCSAPKLSKVKDTFYKIPQYGTCAYLIHRDAINHINNSKPLQNNIDFYYNSTHNIFNSAATPNHIFYCRGSMDSQDKNSEFGSLIWENN